MAVAFAAVSVGGTVTAAPASAASTVTRTVDDTVYRGAVRFAYSGSWKYCQGCRTDALNRSFHYTGRPGAAVRITFTGTRATVYGLRQPAGGIATVTLDGTSRGTVNLKAGTSGIAAVYTTPVLRRGTHTLTLTVSSRTTGRGHTVSVDRVAVQDTAGSTTPSQPSQPPSRPPVQGSGVASFTFDDGQLGHFQNAWPALSSAGYRGTFYVVSDAMGWGGSSMSAAQVGRLAAAGNEIGSHSRDHGHLTGMTNAQVEAEFADSVKALKAAGATVSTCAYPYGEADATVESIAAKYFRACRSTQPGTNGRDADAFNLRVYYVQTSTTAADVRAAADAAKAAGSWIIFVYHGVGAVGSSDDVSTAQFQGHVAAIKASGITVRTVAQQAAAR